MVCIWQDLALESAGLYLAHEHWVKQDTTYRKENGPTKLVQTKSLQR